MTAQLLSGTPAAAEIKQTIQQTVMARAAAQLAPPGLAVIQVGNHPASSIYVQHKRRACLEVGFQSFAYDLPTATSEHALLTLIAELNQTAAVHGILVQLPLPDHIQTARIIEAIDPKKDVDGFHPYNLGRLAQGIPLLRPCTPYGVMLLLKYYQIAVAGMHAVVVGASNIVGRPMLLELLLAKATVTICHQATRQLAQHVRQADLLIIATGKYDLIKPEWLNENHTIIDIGIHRNADGKIHGDLNFAAAVNIVQALTPVPGGVGPMTIATLLNNTLHAASQLTAGA